MTIAHGKLVRRNGAQCCMTIIVLLPLYFAFKGGSFSDFSVSVGIRGATVTPNCKHTFNKSSSTSDCTGTAESSDGVVQLQDETNDAHTHVPPSMALEHAREHAQSTLDEHISKAPEFAKNLSVSGISRVLPSAEKPFAFFHMRKAGGSTLRTLLHKAAAMPHKLTEWIPCTGDTNCIPWEFPPPAKIKTIAIYASHINYSFMSQFLKEGRSKFVGSITSTETVNSKSERLNEMENKNENNRSESELERTFTYHTLQNEQDHWKPFDGRCLTNIRPTVSRVVSCWNYRFLKEKNRLPWNLTEAVDMSPAELNHLLPLASDKYGNGCNNEVARIFGSVPHDESFINTLSPADHGPFFWKELETIIKRVSGCVIVRVDRCEDSNLIMKHYLPWMGDDVDICGRNEKQSYRKKDITNAAEEVILTHNSMDNLVFSFGEKLFEAQLEVAKANVATEG